jgi:DNA polymerase I-like protein with 3'-5' exonuclease and polymerase domains
MKEPDLQNIPVGENLESVRKLREAFNSAFPELPALDYSAIELRVLAGLTEEEIADFLKGPP